MTITQQVIDNTVNAGESAFSAFGKVNANNTALFNAANTASDTYTPLGGVATTVAAKLALTISVFDYMTAAQQANVALYIGSIDVTAAVQAAINAVAAAGGGFCDCPAGSYKIGTGGAGLLISTNNVKLRGAGAGYIRNGGSNTSSPATLFSWGGGSAPTVAILAITSPSGASLFALEGCGSTGIQYECNSLAGFGIQMTSHKNGIFTQNYVLHPITAAYQLTTLLNANLVDTDTQHNVFTQCYWRCIDTAAAKQAHGLWLTNALITSSTNGNTSFNTFIECLGQTDGLLSNASGVGIKIDAGDNNVFYSCINYRNAGSTVPSVQLNGYNSASDSNLFFHFSDTTPANAINILGNATLASGYNPIQNTFIAIDSSNGVNYPTLDAGCRVNWSNTNGIVQSGLMTGAVVAGLGNDVNALAQLANVANEALRIYDASQDHVRWADLSGTPWGTNLDASENFRFSRLAGSGNVVTGARFISANTTAPPANGSAACGIGVSSTANLGIYFGAGAPTFSAAEGSIYSNTTGGAGARLYTNTSAGSGTTWTAATTP